MKEKVFPLISIVIVNFNGKNYITRCVTSILKNTIYPNFEIIIVDNGSTDGSLEELDNKFSGINKINIIRLEKNVGYSKANNIGVRYSKGKFIALLNNDTLVSRGWLIELYKVLISDEKIACVQSKLLLMDKFNKIDSVGHAVDPLGFLRAEGYLEIDKGQYDYLKDICVVQPAACLIKREVIDEVGLFDDDYFWCHEDTDLSFRLHLAGYRIVLSPKSIVYHKRSATVSKFPEYFILYYCRRNILMTLLKCYELKHIFTLIPLHVLFTLGLALLYLFNGKYYNFRAIIKAHIWNLMNLNRTFKKRAGIRKIRLISDRELFKKLDKINIYSLITRSKMGPLVTLHLGSESNEGICGSSCT